MDDYSSLTHSLASPLSFLDKMYFLSDERCLALFMANPRPYLVPPQPRPPCKISVLGPSLSGRTSLSHLIAIEYQATVSMSIWWAL